MDKANGGKPSQDSRPTEQNPKPEIPPAPRSHLIKEGGRQPVEKEK